MGRAALLATLGPVYLTDEVFLYRLVDVVMTDAGAMFEIEDCYGLDVVRIPKSDVFARRLRPVTPTGRAESGPATP